MINPLYGSKKKGKLDDESLFYLGKVYQANLENKRAIRIYKELASKYPDRADIQFEIGIVAFRLNRMREAVAAFEKVLKSEPGNEVAVRLSNAAKLKIPNR